MATILDEIVAYKRQFVAKMQEGTSLDGVRRLAESAPTPTSFFEGLVGGDDIAVVAEIKKASPSRGTIRADFDPVAIAESYASNGASAISVLTDEKFFQGSAGVLTQVSRAVDLPLLRKDFVVDAYQVYEAKAIGAAAVLLIGAILSPAELEALLGLCRAVDLDALVEVHTEEETLVALNAGADIVGINNRDLKTFQTDLETTLNLIDRIPDEVLTVSESGIHTREDVVRLREAGANAVLVGESLMREPDIGRKLQELLGYGQG